MTEEELRRKLGEFYGRFPVFQHRWLGESCLREYGRTSDGTRVTANRLLAESDFVLGLGSVVPHRVKGFSGGAKIAFPGVSGRELPEREGETGPPPLTASSKQAQTVRRGRGRKRSA